MKRKVTEWPSLTVLEQNCIQLLRVYAEWSYEDGVLRHKSRPTKSTKRRLRK